MAINHAGRLIIVLLALRVLIGFGVAWRQTVTVDEPDFIASGLAAWRQGDWTLEPNNPPLTKLLIALPWLAAEAKLPSQDQYREAWNRRDHYAVGKALLFDIERTRTPWLIMISRGIVVILSTASLWLLCLWVHRCAGSRAAIIAALFCLSEPNLLAHSSLATLDALAMATILASCVVFEFALDRVRWRWWLLTGLLGGLALAAKFSALLLLPAFAIRLVIASWQGSLKTWVAAGRYVILCIVAMVVMWACYGFSRVSIASSWQSGPHVAGQTFDQIMTDRHVPQWARPILTEWRLPLADAITGICRVAGVSERGRIAFINGRIYPQGTPFFNFWVFLWKTPSVLLAGLIGGIVVSSKDLIRRGLALCQPASAPSGQPLISCYWPLYYFAFFFVMPFFARNAFAYRYLLPCVPFAIVLAAAALSRVIENARSHLLTAVLSLMILAPLLVTPGQLAFFNMPSRLAGQPYQLAADSNLDWGQGLYALRQAVTRLMDQGVAPPLLAVYSPVSTDYYGLHLPAVTGPVKQDDACIISATEYWGLGQTPGEWYDALRHKPPDSVIANQFLLWRGQ